MSLTCSSCGGAHHEVVHSFPPRACEGCGGAMPVGELRRRFCPTCRPPAPVGPGRWRKLTDAAVETIRERAAGGERQTTLAREFGVSRQAISQIARGTVHRRVGGARTKREDREPSTGARAPKLCRRCGGHRDRRGRYCSPCAARASADRVAGAQRRWIDACSSDPERAAQRREQVRQAHARHYAKVRARRQAGG